MHPKEFRKTKNGTGHLTNLSLENCEIHVGVDFRHNKTVNAIINDPKNSCFVLYPSDQSIDLNRQKLEENEKNIVIFSIDSTWPCSRAILKASPNIDMLQKISFTHDNISGFKFKEQPETYCLSTIESTHVLLTLLNNHGTENISDKKLKGFLKPFEMMVEYQVKYTTEK
jgi:DTW domain-containing protein YfiP